MSLRARLPSSVKSPRSMTPTSIGIEKRPCEYTNEGQFAVGRQTGSYLRTELEFGRKCQSCQSFGHNRHSVSQRSLQSRLVETCFQRLRDSTRIMRSGAQSVRGSANLELC